MVGLATDDESRRAAHTALDVESPSISSPQQLRQFQERYHKIERGSIGNGLHGVLRALGVTSVRLNSPSFNPLVTVSE
jgi:hypothetical protein